MNLIITVIVETVNISFGHVDQNWLFELSISSILTPCPPLIPLFYIDCSSSATWLTPSSLPSILNPFLPPPNIEPLPPIVAISN